jgi:phosphoglycolate phosphatase
MSKNNFPFDGLIFDLDGTLWDAAKNCAAAWNEVLAEHGYSQRLTEDNARSLSGIKIEIMFPQYFSFVPKSQYEDFFESYKNKESYIMKKIGGKLYPNVLETLILLNKKAKLFIVSNCLDGYVENFINLNNLRNLFSDYISAGKTGLEKKENLKLIIERNQIKNPIFIGDTIGDYDAAIFNRIPFIYVSYGFGNVTKFTMKINSFADLLNILKQ